jgi:hypothetical protein
MLGPTYFRRLNKLSGRVNPLKTSTASALKPKSLARLFLKPFDLPAKAALVPGCNNLLLPRFYGHLLAVNGDSEPTREWLWL